MSDTALAPRTNRKQQRTILAVMSDGRWHCVTEFARKGILDYRRRLFELGELGWNLDDHMRTHRSGARMKDWRRTDLDETIRSSITNSLEVARQDILRGVDGGHFVAHVFGRPVLTVKYADIKADAGAVMLDIFEAYTEGGAR